MYLLAPLVLIRLAWRGLRSPEYRQCWTERFGAIHPAVGERVIWVHAVSVGEVQAAESMIRALLELYPEYSILMTTVTATGAAHVTELFDGEVAHVYAPYDLPDVVSRFIDRVRPRLAIVMETELWPNLFRACRRKNIPLLLVNARLSEKSLAGYQRFPPADRQDARGRHADCRAHAARCGALPGAGRRSGQDQGVGQPEIRTAPARGPV